MRPELPRCGNGHFAVVGRLHVVAHRPEEHRQALGGVAVVVHHQDAEVGGRRRQVAVVARGARVGPLHDDRQADHEIAALARPAAPGLDASAVHLHEPLRQTQADAQTALRPRQRPLDLREHLEEGRQLVGGNADSCVRHRHHCVAALKLCTQVDSPAPLCVLGGVVEQV